VDAEFYTSQLFCHLNLISNTKYMVNMSVRLVDISTNMLKLHWRKQLISVSGGNVNLKFFSSPGIFLIEKKLFLINDKEFSIFE
jgi:hypothetical protein